MPTYAEELKDATERLSEITETPRLDAELLLAHALHIPRSRLLASLQDQFLANDFDLLLERRRKGEPLAYIFGEWEFFSLRFEVEAPVLVPRPETEHLVEAVLENVGESSARVLEIGCGTGCVAIAIAKNAPKVHVLATDIRLGNLALGRRNALRHTVEDRVQFVAGDLFEPVRDSDARFDVVCSNPPYVEEGARDSLPTTVRDFEDPGALFSGDEGLDLIRRMIAEAPEYLQPEGLLAMEIGAGQARAVEQLLTERGYRTIRFQRDLAGIERIATAKAPTS